MEENQSKEERQLQVIPKPVLMTMGDAKLFAEAAYKSGIFSDVKSEAQALIKVMAGHELGIPPIMSMQKLYIVKNKLGMGVEVMGALLQQRGYTWTIKYDDLDKPTACEVTFAYPNHQPYTSRFTLKDAERAGLIKPDGAWTTYPKDLLFARAFSSGARKYAPEALSGLGYTREELESIPVEVVIEDEKKEVKPVEVKTVIASEATQPIAQLEQYLEEAKPLAHPLEQFLKECPEHGDKWGINKYKKRFHKTPDGTFCNFSNAIKPIAAEIVKSAGYDGETFPTFLKDTYKKTWSKISEEEQIGILALLDRKEGKSD